MVGMKAGTKADMKADMNNAANQIYKLPPRLFDARCKACWFVLGVATLVVLSFWSLDLQWAKFLSAGAFTLDRAKVHRPRKRRRKNPSRLSHCFRRCTNRYPM